MTKEERESLKDKFLALLPQDGSVVGNMTQCPKFLKGARKIVTAAGDEDYWDIRNDLLDDGQVGVGRGRGGSVFLVIENADVEKDEKVSTVYESESDLYEPFYKIVSTTWAKQNNVKSYVSEITAQQGRRNTGGAWTRTDVTVVSVGKFAFIPGKVLDVITFEIKTLDDFSITGLFEAAAHNAS